MSSVLQTSGRRWIAYIGLGVACVLGLIVFNPFVLFSSTEEPADVGRDVAAVSNQLLEQSFGAAGEIEFVDAQTVPVTQVGLVNKIAATEDLLVPGDTLYEFDQQAVLLFEGEIPAYRDMSVNDVGVDVKQLETNLVALGYGTDSELTIDETFTSATATVVRRWQADVGLAETGTVSLGTLVFGPAETRVGRVQVEVGDTLELSQQPSPVMIISGVDRQLVFDTPAGDVGSLKSGAEVSARLPDRSTVDATVETFAQSGQNLWTVTAKLVDPKDLDEKLPPGDAFPAEVSWKSASESTALNVPAKALIRLESGGYAVEVVDSLGSDSKAETVETGEPTRLVKVDVGERFGTAIEITPIGDPLEAGQMIISP